MRIGVIGAGSWGTTFASMLAARHDTVLSSREVEVAESVSNDHENRLFLGGVALTQSLRASTSLEEVIEDRELLVVAVPTQHLRGVADTMTSLVARDCPIVSLAKGLELGSMLRPTQILDEVLSSHDTSLARSRVRAQPRPRSRRWPAIGNGGRDP